MRIGIVQKSCMNQRAIMEYSLPNKREYSLVHGYDLFVDHHEFNQNKRRNWLKVEAILKCFDKDWDWIFWSDVDSIIMNYSIPLESLIPDKDVHMVASFFPMDEWTKAQTAYPFEYTVHAGNFLIKKSEWCYNLLKECYSDPRFSWDLMTEESAITYRYRENEEIRRNIHIIHLDKLCTVAPHPFENINFFKQYSDGDFLIHFLGQTIPEKIKGVKKYALKASLLNSEE